MVLRIANMIATSGFLTVLECSKFVVGRGSTPDPTGGAHSAPPCPLAGLRGLTFKVQVDGRERGKGEGKKRGREREGPPFSLIPESAHEVLREPC